MSTKKRSPYNVDPQVLLQNDDYLNIRQAVQWIKETYDVQVTRQTVYRWIKGGLRGARWRGRHKRRLHSMLVCGQLITKKQWINDFITEIAICSPRR